MEQAEIRIRVGIGDYEVAQAPYVLETLSLGSCVGIALHDPVTKIGGLIHIMLPSPNQSASVLNPAKFADTGIQLLVKEMERRGANRSRITAKIAGGASMFTAAVQDPAMTVGNRNVDAVKATINALQIRILGSDTGGTWGRTMIFTLDTGNVVVKSAHKETVQI